MMYAKLLMLIQDVKSSKKLEKQVLIIGLSLFPMSQLHSIFSSAKYCAVGSWEIVKELLLALVFHVFLK